MTTDEAIAEARAIELPPAIARHASAEPPR
jgi:hypothetical protein